MGRRKIIIRPITDQKLRHTTFNKRKNGLIKKAAELSMLCDLKLLLIFEDTTGALVQYSTHGIFNQFEYFTNFMEEKIIQFSPKDYPNFFKVNHYKKNNKVAIKEYEKQQTKFEKSKKQALIIPKLSEKGSCNNSMMGEDTSPIVQKRELIMNDPSYPSLDPTKTDSQLSLETGLTQTPDNQQNELKKKNIKNLSINIPDKNKYLEYQMSALKNSNNFQTLPSNTVKLPSPHTHMRMQSPLIKPAQSPITKSTNKFPSTFTKGLKPTETPNLFFSNDYFFGQNFDNVKTPDLPSYMDPSPISHPNQMHQAHLNQLAHMTQPMSSAQMNPQQMMNMNQGMTPQMNAQINAQMSMSMNAHMNGVNPNNMMNNVQANTPNPMSVNTGPFKLGGFFDSLDSPYTKYNFNQKMFYPLMGFTPGAGTEEGFSPFLKSNMALDINTNSTLAKKEKNSFFTFKNELPGNKPEGFEGNNENANGTGNLSGKQDNFEEKMRPKKKLKLI